MFKGRTRRPPKDPVNGCLSLIYTLVHQLAVDAIKAAGLDPMLGVYHELCFGRDSLACDFVEPLRPVVDDWVWCLFRNRELRVENFNQKSDGCFLNDSGKKVFYEAFYKKVPSFRRLFRRYASTAALRCTQV